MKIFVCEDFLTEDDLILLKNYVLTKKNAIIKDRKLTNQIWDTYKEKFSRMNENIIGLQDEVTITNSNKPIGLHKDAKINDSKWKILIYLNDMENGGTIFIVDDKEYLIENKKNKCLIFDMDLYHKSQNFIATDTKNKLCIGFRAKSAN